MSRRGLLSLLNTGVVVGTIAVWFLFPQYALYALYGTAAWIAVAFGLTWMTARSVGTPLASSPEPAAPGAAARGGPAPSAARAAPSRAIDFCVYCGTHYAPEQRRCTSCGHALPRHVLPT